MYKPQSRNKGNDSVNVSKDDSLLKDINRSVVSGQGLRAMEEQFSISAVNEFKRRMKQKGVSQCGTSTAQSNF